MTDQLFWYLALAFALTIYTALDGFDLGAGMIHLLAAKTEEERKTVINAIGPVWDGNEVWLIAAGGIFFLAFPAAYAASFSGFYLPLMMALWLYMMRALSIELRRHLDNDLWRSFWDAVFCGSSGMLTAVLGMALGNVLRGVRFDRDGSFFAPLWTNFRVTGDPGIIDWYTVLFCLLSSATLVCHGAGYLIYKTEGDLRSRSEKIHTFAFLFTIAASLACLGATYFLHPEYLNNYIEYPALAALPALSMICFLVSFVLRKKNDAARFLGSLFMILFAGAGSAAALYPLILADTSGSGSLTVYNSSTGSYSLSTGRIWWIPGMLLVFAYFSYLYFTFRGKIGATRRKHY